MFNWANNWTCFWKFRVGIAGLISPWLRDQPARHVSITWTVVFKPSWVVALFKRLSTLVASCLSKKIPSFGLCFCSWPMLGLCTWAPSGGEGPFEKPWLRNKSCKRLGSRPKRSIILCCTNWTIKLTCIWARLRANLLQLEPVAILRGAWVGHAPTDFCLPPLWPPQFFS